MTTTEINLNKLKEKVFGCLFGVAIGDALGLPVETMSPEGIRSEFGYVDYYIQNKKHKFGSIAKRAPGTVSDDTQLTLAIMDSIARNRGYNLADIRTAHVEAFDGKWGKPLGWGGSTKFAISRMRDNQSVTCSPDGAGNGTCMKISPLSIYCVYRTLSTPHKKFTNSFNASLFKKVSEITRLTHGHPMCIVAAYCQARMVIRALQDEIPLDYMNISGMFIRDAEYAEEKLNIKWEKKLSHRLQNILRDEHAVFPCKLSTATVSELICTQQSSYVYNSYPLVAYCVSKYLPYRNFVHGVLETVNAGADADSNGAMVGAILGARLGLYSIPTHFIHDLKATKMIFQQIRNFHQSM